MFWSIYLLTSVVISHIISLYFRKIYFITFPLFITLFITPTSIEISEGNLAPSIFTFFFNVFLEKDYGTRVLRPLLITLPICLVIVFLLTAFKKKFFPQKGQTDQ